MDNINAAAALYYHGHYNDQESSSDEHQQQLQQYRQQQPFPRQQQPQPQQQKEPPNKGPAQLVIKNAKRHHETNIYTNQRLHDTAARLDNAISELWDYSELLLSDMDEKKKNKKSRKEAILNMKDAIVPLLRIAADTLREAANQLAPFPGTRRLHDRNDNKRKREVIDPKSEKSPSLQMIEHFLATSNVDMNLLKMKLKMKLEYSLNKSKHGNAKAASAVAVSALTEDQSKGETALAAAIEKKKSAIDTIILPTPKNGTMYTKLEALKVINSFKNNTKSRGIAINAIIKRGYVPIAKSAIYNMMNKHDRGLKIVDDGWNVTGRPRKDGTNKITVGNLKKTAGESAMMTPTVPATPTIPLEGQAEDVALAIFAQPKGKINDTVGGLAMTTPTIPAEGQAEDVALAIFAQPKGKLNDTVGGLAMATPTTPAEGQAEDVALAIFAQHQATPSSVSIANASTKNTTMANSDGITFAHLPTLPLVAAEIACPTTQSPQTNDDAVSVQNPNPSNEKSKVATASALPTPKIAKKATTDLPKSKLAKSKAAKARPTLPKAPQKKEHDYHLPPPTNGTYYYKLEALAIIKRYKKGSKDRSNVINTMLNLDLIPSGKRSVYALLKQDEQGLTISNDAWPPKPAIPKPAMPKVTNAKPAQSKVAKAKPTISKRPRKKELDHPLPQPTNGKFYSKLEALELIKPHRKNSRDRSSVIKAMIKYNYVPNGKSHIYELLKQYEEGIPIINDAWNSIGRTKHFTDEEVETIVQKIEQDQSGRVYGSNEVSELLIEVARARAERTGGDPNSVTVTKSTVHNYTTIIGSKLSSSLIGRT